MERISQMEREAAFIWIPAVAYFVSWKIPSNAKYLEIPAKEVPKSPDNLTWRWHWGGVLKLISIPGLHRLMGKKRSKAWFKTNSNICKKSFLFHNDISNTKSKSAAEGVRSLCRRVDLKWQEKSLLLLWFSATLVDISVQGGVSVSFWLLVKKIECWTHISPGL